MRRMIAIVLSTFALCYFALCIGVYLYQRSLIFYPQHAALANATNTIKMKAGKDDIVISAYQHEGNKALIYFGGNAEDVSVNLPILTKAFPDHAIYLMHYRGYGGSTGAPSERAIQQDALGLYDKVFAQHPNIAVIGRSLGTGVAIRVAAVRPVAKLVLVTPYDSLEEIAAQQFPYLPVRWLLTDKFQSGQVAADIKSPTLILMAEHDELIPRDSTEKLYSRFTNGTAKLKTISGAGHNTISNHQNYIFLLKTFIQDGLISN